LAIRHVTKEDADRYLALLKEGGLIVGYDIEGSQVYVRLHMPVSYIPISFHVIKCDRCKDTGLLNEETCLICYGKEL
jgi:hypothetical protein